MLTVTKTFTLVTPESAENGEAEDSGFMFEDRECDDLTMASQFIDQLGFFDGVGSFPDVYGVGEDVDYRSGGVTTYALHFDGTAEELEELRTMLARHLFNACKQ